MNISFVYPGFLFALALLAIPIIIHLFNFRRFRKVYFTNVKFLRELKEETTSQSKLKHLLVLLSRLLAVAFLVLAFAQPYIPAETGQKLVADRAISIFIDNSFSMEAVTREGTLLDVARGKAKEIAAAYKPSDRFQLLTNDFDPVHQRLVSREELLSAIDGIRISPVSRTLSEVLSRQKDALNNSGALEKSSMILSDFQETMADFETVASDSSLPVFLLPVSAGEVANISIDSCWFSVPVVQLGQVVELNVRIRNSGKLDASAVPVKLVLNKVQRAVAAAEIPSMNYTDVKMSFTASEPGWQKATVSITDQPITFDDHYYFSFTVSQQSDILAINRNLPSPALNALFVKGGYFVLSNNEERQLDYSSLAKNNVIFLNELNVISSGLTAELLKYVNNGGTLVVIPDSAMDRSSYNTFTSSFGIPSFGSMEMNNERVEKLALEDKIFEGVFSSSERLTRETDMPFVNGYFMQSGSSSGSAEMLMQLRSGAPFLTRYLKGNGVVYFFTSPFSGTMSNFTRHALFVPVVYRIALLSGNSMKSMYFIGKDDKFDVASINITGDNIFHLKNSEIGFDAIPGHRSTGTGVTIILNNQIVNAGHYDLTLGNELKAVASFNFNRNESLMQFFDSDALGDRIRQLKLFNFNVFDTKKAELTKSFSAMNQGTRLWKYYIILVLLFLACEILLLKFWKK